MKIAHENNMSLEFLSENFHSYDQQWKIPFFILWKIAFPPCRLICKIFMEKWFSDFPRIALLKLIEMLTKLVNTLYEFPRHFWKLFSILMLDIEIISMT